MAEGPDPAVIRRMYPVPEFVNAPPPTRDQNCFICIHAQLGEQTICPFYGPVLDERIDAIGCLAYIEDPDAT